MAFFHKLKLFFGIAVVLALNFSDIFAATDTTTYCQKKVPIDSFMKKLFYNDFKVRTLDLTSDTMITILAN